ncbi:MAG: HD domain-containing protein [Lachnospiraceae bacterium]|nr:HD domain-containing protein [Lachnospiraceae bacterium]
MNERLKNYQFENERLKNQLNFLIEVDKMKTVLRQTVLIDKSRQETDAEHSWHFALSAVTLFEYCILEQVDLNHVIKMALVHDLIEIYAGDTFAFDVKGNEDKAEREQKAADKLFTLLPKEQGEAFRTLWEEFEAMETPEALYAAAIDRFQPFLSNSVTDGHTWVKFGVRLEQVYKRMEPVKITAPILYEYVETVIADALAKGYIHNTPACPASE